MLVVCAPTAVKLAQKFGKKELSTASAVVAAAAFLACYLVHPENPYVYVAFTTIVYIGMGYFNTVIWAMITDVIDDTEIRTGVREDGTVYAVHSFARKLGRALSSGLIGALLSLIGYTEATAYDPIVTGKIFDLSCVAPAIGFALLAVILIFLPVSMIEQRYEWEEQMLEAVARGDEIQAIEQMKQGARFTMMDRFGGTLYREKTKLIILNTSFRKAIARSNVHPYYIDQISAVYARRIEELSDVTGDEALVTEMIRDYCAYVRRYSLKGYSPAVQKVINHINLNVAEAHTLKSLSALCHISPTYLSTLFKQETGSTLIDYINTQRVRRASHLLETTDRTVASIAEEMGILDVNYFARIFKRTFGVTPTRYRREKRNQQSS